MKRSPLTRRTPLRRKIRIKLRNPKRLAKLRASQFGPQAALCRTMPCCCCKAPPPSDPHHLKSRGAGGDDSFCVPLCRRCHQAVHTQGAEQWFYLRHVKPEDVLERMRMLVADSEPGEGLAVNPLLGWLDS